jgi:replicative DNA helicase
VNLKRDSKAAVNFDRTPPQNIEAERSVLGAMLLNPDAVGTAIEILRDRGEDMFYLEQHQHIYDAILALSAKNMPIDAVVMMDQLVRSGKLQAAGGVSYLAELTRAVPTSANVESYARIVFDCALLRDVIQTGTRLVSEAYSGETPAAVMLDHVERDLLRISQHATRTTNQPITTALDEAAESMIARIRGESHTGCLSGYKDLDAVLWGFQPGDSIVLAARPSVGKTVFALNLAVEMAYQGKRGIIFSLEMSAEALAQRLICGEAGVRSHDLREGKLGTHDIPRILAARDAIAALPIDIDDLSHLDVARLRSRSRQIAARQGLDFVIIDYLQLMAGDTKAENRQVLIAEISRSIKGLARELKVPIILLAQLSRQAEEHKDGPPRLSWLRESGAIEQDADVVLMLARDSSCLKVHVVKHRNGPTTPSDAPVLLHFDGPTQKISSWRDGQPVSDRAPRVPPPQRYRPPNDFDGDQYYELDDPLAPMPAQTEGPEQLPAPAPSQMATLEYYDPDFPEDEIPF